jgi:hypothetical protein
MNRIPALAWVLAATMASPAVARSVNIPPPPTAAGDISGAASIAAGYGVVTSTYRSVAHNRAVGGVANSFHLSGRAIDIARRPGVTHAQIAAALKQAGYAMIESLDEGDHSHFAFATTPAAAQPVVAAAATPPEPSKPEPPKVLADNHGTLLIDLPPAERSAGTVASASVSQVRGTKAVGNQGADGMPLAR